MYTRGDYLTTYPSRLQSCQPPFLTLCVCFSWFFEVLGYPKSSRPNITNGVLMAAIFFFVRIAVMPVYYSRMYTVYGTEAFYRVPLGGRGAWIFSSFCLDIMNIMWMHKIARGCYRVMRARDRPKAQLQENGKADWSVKMLKLAFSTSLCSFGWEDLRRDSALLSMHKVFFFLWFLLWPGPLGTGSSLYCSQVGYCIPSLPCEGLHLRVLFPTNLLPCQQYSQCMAKSLFVSGFYFVYFQMALDDLDLFGLLMTRTKKPHSVKHSI